MPGVSTKGTKKPTLWSFHYSGGRQMTNEQVKSMLCHVVHGKDHEESKAERDM